METYVQAFERAKRRADFLTAVLSLDEDLWSGNAALLINVTADLARAKSHDDVVKRSVEAMLANEETRRLAIGGFLARPDVIAEEKLLPAIQEELTSESAFESYVSINETFLILQGIKQESSLKSLRDFVSSRRAAGRQPSVSARNPDEGIVNASEGSNTEGSHPPLAEAKEELLLVFLNARLGDRAEVEKQLTAMLVDVARKAPSSGLSATFSPAGEKGQDDGAVSASVGDSTRQRRQDSFPAGEKGQDKDADTVASLRLMLFAMNARLKDMGAEWLNSRRMILEWMLNQPIAQDDFDSLADSLTASDDAVMEELGAVYELLGDSAKSRAIMNRRIQALIANTDVSGEGSSESIRQLLQAGEKIQASGFPIEGARLLLNVTSHDIDEFTSDLDDDKAIAFKSRYNASQRWARQQITPEKLIAWFEMSVDGMEDEVAPPPVDLLLEISGTTDPRSRDEEHLNQLRLDSVLLTVVARETVDREAFSDRVRAAIGRLTAMKKPDIRLLGIAFAIARKFELQAEMDAVGDSLARVTSMADDTEAIVSDRADLSQRERNEVARSGSENRVPAILRRDSDLACVLIAGLLVDQPTRIETVRKLLNRSHEAAERCPNRIVQIAVLQEAANVASRAGFTELATALKADSGTAIDRQVQSTSSATAGNIDLSHEIRTRLLKSQ
jgi:hypothetical protein